MTRRPRFVTSYYGWTGSGADIQSYVLSYEPRDALGFSKEVAEEDERERKRYGVAVAEAMAAVPFAELLKADGN
ncbi:hypothetical protein [Streptomyces peucetius]|uniref:Uncharacterized protein n=1 Tax=Streptomyces peucetius TaxID=1950 RepID=A0ABY6IH46_STRPE|nr:hypothetical protein [Streptomyces peucetius]UYQ66054.1 hypothetical protein OGH68_34420 [Streptomyces peucetius]